MWNFCWISRIPTDDQCPEVSAPHPDRGLHAKEALEGSFHDQAVSAERCGWSADETAFALLNLATARILTLNANRSTEDEIARAAALVGGMK